MHDLPRAPKKRKKLKDIKKVVFLAGRPSHGYGAHEHNAGSLLLSRILNEQEDRRVLATVYPNNGWPSSQSQKLR